MEQGLESCEMMDLLQASNYLIADCRIPCTLGEGPRQREDSLGDRAIRVLGREPFHPVGIRFVRPELGPLIGHFVVLDALVAWAPPNLDPGTGLLGPKGGDVPSGFGGVLLPRSRFVEGHPSYGRLAAFQDGYQPRRC